MVPRPMASPDDVFVPRSSSAGRAPEGRKHLGALVAAPITATAALASAAPEQLTLAHSLDRHPGGSGPAAHQPVQQ